VSDHRDRSGVEVSAASARIAYRLGHATQVLVDAALAWGDRDYGEVGELEADAALNDAIRQFKQAVADQALASEVGRAAS
jgi:hypothetical protein